MLIALHARRINAHNGFGLFSEDLQCGHRPFNVQ